MANAKMKTAQNDSDVLEFLHSIEPEKRRADGLKLLDFMNEVTKLKPKLWGPSIVGYGRYHYKYDSGRQGDMLLTGFSPRKTSLTLYVMHGFNDQRSLLQKLGKHKIGKSCLYVNKLEDIDMAVLKDIVEKDMAYMRSHYETWDE